MKICRVCKSYLDEKNWYTSMKKKCDHICISCFKIKCNRIYRANKEAYIERSKQWRLANTDRSNRSKYKYKEKNIEIIREKGRQYTKNNPHIVNANTAKRRATKKQATPSWITNFQLDQIKSLYKLAKELEASTGLKFHVDHIVPLCGENVCGLHVPWNLRVIEASENTKKSNKLILDLVNTFQCKTADISALEN